MTRRMRFIFVILGLSLAGQSGCAFVPRVVDVNKNEARISYPNVDFSGRHKMEFGSFSDARPSKTDFGYLRNKFMIITGKVTMKGDLLPVVEKMIRKNFLSAGIEEGSSPYIVNAKLLEAHSDLPGPDHLFVRIRISLTVTNKKENVALFHRTFTGYSVVGVMQLGNTAHENAFVNAMNQINDQISVVAISVANSFNDRGPYIAGGGGAEDKSKGSSGTAFFITKAGLLLTNDHVVDKCVNITVKGWDYESKATIVYKDPVNDLALLKADMASGVAYFRSGRSIRIGDEIITIGFPLFGTLASGVKVTTGIVSALAGISNDITQMQITAPIQPGNSGGPLLDKSGHVVGIVSSKLDEIAVAQVTGSISQNVNFAIKSSTVQTFLDTREIDYETETSHKQMDTADIVDEARKFTVQVLCLH